MTSCTSLGVIGKIVSISTPTIVQGSDLTIDVQLVYKDSAENVDLTDFTSASGFFPKNDTAAVPAYVAVSGAVVSADKGILRFELSEAQTALLQAGDEVSFEVGYDLGALRTFIQFEGSLSIAERLF